jgi:hypothetical protein
VNSGNCIPGTATSKPSQHHPPSKPPSNPANTSAKVFLPAVHPAGEKTAKTRHNRTKKSKTLSMVCASLAFR